MIEKRAYEMQGVLLRECEEFQQLHQRHQELDDRLGSLASRRVLSDSEKLEESTIKQKKLAIKDRMAFMLRSH